MADERDYPKRWAQLPPDFRYGVVTAATCIESRVPVGGDLSIWDVFAAAPGRVTDNSHPGMGPDHLTHWERDVELLAELGVNAYRFSLSWSALAARPADIGFYDRLIDALVDRGIAPVITLTHYDMPLEVMERGGWLTRDTAAEFSAWTATVAAPLVDRVHAWITLNAPLAHTGFGYGLGIEAPGLTLLAGALHAGQHQLIGHGLAVQALRAAGAGRIGIANAHTTVSPATDSPGDAAAARLYDALHNRAFADPIFGRPWPSELIGLPGAPDDAFTDADRASIAAPLDFYGVNYYHPQRVEDAPDNRTIPFAFTDPGAGTPADEFGWPTDPASLTATLRALADRYPELPPLWVTENGTQDSGGVADDRRSGYLLDHLAAVADAVADGVRVDGYFHWSLLDGWEFAEGLSRHFGLVAVDPDSRERLPKASFHTYQRLLAGQDVRPIRPVS